MKLLMHTCCAPCSVYCIDSLRAENIEPTLFWYNPNIHPYIEYKTRRDCLKDYAASIDVNLIIDEEYGLDEFCKNVVSDLENRCVNYCYKKRLTETVRYAAHHGYDTFTTTLLVSPYQKHDELIAVCKELEALSGVKFLYRDFRVGFREGQAKARALGLYLQKYCGCIFSEEDRYKKQILRDAATTPKPALADAPTLSDLSIRPSLMDPVPPNLSTTPITPEAI
ncbi:epoxyqueuosine reductase QueH [Candidatus Saccharibacteria bacterium]|nr:epoxyqueuosine reductase QueH [Candidatus Saccharibacteria bacterium]MBQ6375597.1 epoxyqueuosine reductase QueH [Candidatus Saccharibacteria bacterium]